MQPYNQTSDEQLAIKPAMKIMSSRKTYRSSYKDGKKKNNNDDQQIHSMMIIIIIAG